MLVSHYTKYYQVRRAPLLLTNRTEARVMATLPTLPAPPPRLRILVGVMSGPDNQRRRNQIRHWSARFVTQEVTVRFVLGREIFNSTRTPRVGRVQRDVYLVDGREGLPHVGVVTEKSAYFWQTIAAAEPAHDYYCKTDDDTLVHLDRLHAVLSEVERQMPGRLAYLGHVCGRTRTHTLAHNPTAPVPSPVAVLPTWPSHHDHRARCDEQMKWRGWEVNAGFKACGGNWGGAFKTKEDLLHGGIGPDGRAYPACDNAAGPFPYMSGGFNCMSRPLARLLAHDAAFGHFVASARARNDRGTPCASRAACASQPAATRMWHHEDAGIAFNLFRAVVRRRSAPLPVRLRSALCRHPPHTSA